MITYRILSTTFDRFQSNECSKGTRFVLKQRFFNDQHVDFQVTRLVPRPRMQVNYNVIKIINCPPTNKYKSGKNNKQRYRGNWELS
jgi:hypothetical protein